MKLIDKNKLLEELKKLKQNLSASPIVVIEDVESLVENLEVKEVDLEEEMNKWRQKHFEGIDYILDGSGEWLERASQLDIARHFFELGLKAQKL